MTAPFFKRAVAFFSRKSGTDTSLSEISNDELVTAYEFVQYPNVCHWYRVPETTSPHGWQYIIRPNEVNATLRKLGAR